MTRILTGFILFFALLALSACESSDYPIDPSDLEGKTQSEMEPMFEDRGWDVEFQTRSSVIRDRSHVFIDYGQVSESQSRAYIIVSATSIDEESLFEPVDIDYDGPRLDEKYLDESAWPLYEKTADDTIGGGGAFEATYTPGSYHDEGGGCIDGDTTVFGYPDEIASRIESNTPSTRYFNVDTPETTREQEEWGFAAKNFTCETLSDAEGVMLQTDPGDNFTGKYGRLLAWVWYIPEGEEDYELLNYNIVRQGLGTVEYEYGAGETGDTAYDGTNYNDWMHQAEDFAIEEERGMHNEDLYSPYWDYDTDSPKQG
ncbi:MAG: thermonuclease family protein [Candidatus Izemoplasmataceae bacterium]